MRWTASRRPNWACRSCGASPVGERCSWNRATASPTRSTCAEPGWQAYAFLDDWVLGALERVGIEARYVPLNDISSPQGKIGGAAQKRLAGGAVLHHVTMSYDIDAEKMTRVLRIGREKLSDKGTTSA